MQRIKNQDEITHGCLRTADNVNVVPGEEDLLASQSQHVLKFARAKSEFKLI